MLAVPLAVLCASAPAEARAHRHRAAAAAHDDSVIALRRVAPGETWVVRQSTRLKKLVIAEGGHIEAPAGRTLTLSIDGVGTTVAPGSYAGEIALNVPLELRLNEPGLEGEHPRAGLYVYSGLFLPEKSTAALLVGGRVGNGSAAGFSLASTEGEFVGAILAGSASYTLTAARIDVAGTGLLVSGSTQVTVAGGSHIAAGRTALRLSGQGSSVLLDGADVRAGNGLLAEFLPGAYALLRIRASHLAGNVLYATDAGAQAALARRRCPRGRAAGARRRCRGACARGVTGWRVPLGRDAQHAVVGVDAGFGCRARRTGRGNARLVRRRPAVAARTRQLRGAGRTARGADRGCGPLVACSLYAGAGQGIDHRANCGRDGRMRSLEPHGEAVEQRGMLGRRSARLQAGEIVGDLLQQAPGFIIQLARAPERIVQLCDQGVQFLVGHLVLRSRSTAGRQRRHSSPVP